jgi:lysophospholipase L1-like esterase
MQPRKLTFLLSLFWLCPAYAMQADPPFALTDGDRIVFVGDGLFEAALDYGWLEYALTTRWPDRRLTFRNIGWSGDTPAGASRDHFTNPPTAYEHLVEQITTARPTIAFVGYGSFLGTEPAGALPTFLDDLSALLDTLAARDVRVVLVSPAPHEPERSPVPNPAAINESLRVVTERLASTAAERGYPFIDLYDSLLPAAANPDRSITQNGIHLNDTGYRMAAAALERQLGLPERLAAWTFHIGDPIPSSPPLSDLVQSEDRLTFSVTPPILPLSSDPSAQSDAVLGLSIQGLPRGRYVMKIDGREVTTASAREFADGLSIPHPQHAQADRVRRSILEKNRIFFHQYRPQNETYLVGFREYEQGQNARELDLLNSFIGQQENEIGRWDIPREVEVHLERVE